MHICEVFDKLKEEKLLVNLKKYGFVKDLVYLGFIVSTKDLQRDPEKVRSFLEWPTIRSATKVTYFHGLASFYIKFIRDFSNIYGPLIGTMKRDRKECNRL